MGQRSYDIWIVDPDGNRVRQTVVEEVDDAVLAAETNAVTLQQRAAAALDANAAFLALGSPTNAQVVGQVRLLTRECTALVRLLLRQLDTTDGT